MWPEREPKPQRGEMTLFLARKPALTDALMRSPRLGGRYDKRRSCPMPRLTIRNLLWLAVFLALGLAWFYYSWRLSIGTPAARHDSRPPDEAISEYRQLLNNLN